MYKKSSCLVRHPKKSASLDAPMSPRARWCARSWRKERSGARPVPGPTMTKGGGGGPARRGRILREPGLIQTGTLPPREASKARKEVQTPKRRILVGLV